MMVFTHIGIRRSRGFQSTPQNTLGGMTGGGVGYFVKGVNPKYSPWE